MLRSAGITPLDFDGRLTDEPVVLAWMPAASIYFHDPDGHLLEYIAMLPEDTRDRMADPAVARVATAVSLGTGIFCSHVGIPDV